MKRIIVDYKKLDKNTLNLLSKTYPDGYGDKDIISFKNYRNELIEAVELKTNDTIFLIKVEVKLAEIIEKYQEEDETTIVSNTKVEQLD